MSMELYYDLKDERLHLISVLKDLNTEIKVLNGAMQFIECLDKKRQIQNKINFIYFRKCEAEKRITEINLQCKKIGRKYNKECLAIKKQKKLSEVK